MAESGQPWGLIVLEIIASFIFGLVMKKKVARYFIRAWKWLSNSITSINFISIRTYNSVEKIIFNTEVFHDMQNRISNIKLDSFSDTSMQIGLSPFGTMIIILALEPNLDDRDTSEEIKISLVIKDPIRIGLRDMDLVHDYIHTIDLIFHVIESKFSETPKMNSNYIIAEMPRVGGFLEEKTLEIDDEALSTHIHATVSKITISAKPPTHIAKAVKKYLFA